MTIKRLIHLAAMVAMVSLLATALVFAFGINSIRVGGPNHHQLQNASDLQADILPPPLFLVEAMLEATRLASDPAGGEQRIARLARLREDFRTRQAFWMEDRLTPTMADLLRGSVVKPGDDFWKIVDGQLVPAVRRGDRAAADVALQQVNEAFQRHRAGVDQLVRAAEQHKNDMLSAADSALWTNAATLTLLGLLLIGGTLFFALLLNRRVVKPLNELADTTLALSRGDQQEIPHRDRTDELGQLAKGFVFFRDAVVRQQELERSDAAEKAAMVDTLADILRRVAQGDLRRVLEQDFQGDYSKLGEIMNGAIESLRSMIQEVVTRSGSIQLAAGEIAAASADLSARTQSNAASIEQTSAALVDVDGRISSTRDAALSTATSAERARAAVECGLAKAQSAATVMAEVRDAAASVDGVMEALDKIAFQTRVLAMNAAVEAGHAGEVGKGFAVVADLVSQLAARAEAEARNAREQLTATTGRIALAVEGVSEVEVQFSQIVDDVVTVTTLVDRLSADARAQASAVAEISAAMRQMDISTQQNAAMVEQTSAAAANLLGDAGQLVSHAQRFQWERRERDLPVALDRRGRPILKVAA
ncbi:methyl-accepting chemotaxis protein [Sphingomonas humi]|uniref:Methyl-accepting chemotaxis protein n=1 Tax=Sphingomonas humi TaxID=335630 RepID=A0ABP7RS91_9SPHN